jgi:hypothetical protein
MGSSRLDHQLAIHRASVREFIERAAAVPEDRWLVPRGDGKWTPAQEARHLVLTYQAAMRDLRREQRMQLRGSRVRRMIWKAIGLTWIIWLRRLPRAVRAPREVRPEWESAAAAALLPELRRSIEEFEVAFVRTWNEEPGQRLTHPFFGAITLDHAIQVLAVHNRHHAAFLPPLPRT